MIFYKDELLREHKKPPHVRGQSADEGLLRLAQVVFQLL